MEVAREQIKSPEKTDNPGSRKGRFKLLRIMPPKRYRIKEAMTAPVRLPREHI
jgi:hypothetical protein